ncbi:ATP-dependent DNA helicase PIF1-like protein, partial [Tanacetum coccineum]
YEDREEYDANEHKIQLVAHETKVVTPREFMHRAVKQLVGSIRETEPETECVIYATVHSIQYESGWTYIGCKICSKKVVPLASKGPSSSKNKQTWWCEKHERQDQVASRYILSVVPNGNRQDVVHATINSSYLWNHCTVMKLTVHMRLGSGSNSSERKEIQDFADWILNIRNGKIGGKNNGEENVEFLDDMLILNSDDHIGSIIHETYPDLLQNIYDPDYFQKRAILAPTHELVDMINDRMLSLLHGDEKTYNSSDMVGVADVDTNFSETMYTEEFLNNLNMAGIPHHSIKLKIAKIISGGSVGTICAIPRMVTSPYDNKLPFKLN